MKLTLKTVLMLILGVSLIGIIACEDEEKEVKLEVTAVEVSPSSATINKDETQQFTYSVKDQNGDEMSDVSVTWSSSDETVTTIDASGLATGAGAGSATITATAESISGTASISVELTTGQMLTGIWLADASTGDLGNVNPGSGGLAGAGWTSYGLTLNADGTFSATGSNPYDLTAYGGDDDGIVNYSGTYTIDETKSPMWIDLTCTETDLTGFFSADAAVQPLQNGIFELNADASELTIQYGSELAFGVPRPTEFLVDVDGVVDSGTLVKQ